MRVLRPVLLLILLLGALPASAYAQATLAGVVKDPSGGVLPGVTVEAASPVLIEKVRSAITDGTGQYQIVDLRPGAYNLTFTLSGFATAKREGVEVTGSGVITINAEMKVGNVAETVNVTGAQPIVDVQSTRRQSVLDNQVINELPVSRSYGSVLAAVPTMQGAGANSSASQNPSFFTVHGGPANEGRVQLDGMNVGAAFNGGGVSGNAYDIANAQEMQITLSGSLGEAEVGGPVLNIVPKTGGNTFKGTIFVTGAGKWAQGNNLDAAQKALGVAEAAGLIKLWDASFALGGPIKRDKLWFFANIRDEGNHTDIPGLFGNKYAGDASHWDYLEDQSVKGRLASSKTIGSVRLTSQVTPRNKVSFYYDYQKDCDQSSQSLTEGCRSRGTNWTTGSVFGSGFSPEAVSNYWDAREIISQVSWSSPVTSKLLLDVREPVGLDAPAGRRDESGPDDQSGPDVQGLSRGRQHARQLAEPERLAGVCDVRDGRAQSQVRVSRRLPCREHDGPRRRSAADAHRSRLRPARPVLRHDPYFAVAAEQSHRVPRDLCAGPVDAGASHAARGGSLRSSLELVPGRA
jgi:hypothetical protein